MLQNLVNIIKAIKMVRWLLFGISGLGKRQVDLRLTNLCTVADNSAHPASFFIESWELVEILLQNVETFFDIFVFFDSKQQAIKIPKLFCRQLPCCPYNARLIYTACTVLFMHVERHMPLRPRKWKVGNSNMALVYADGYRPMRMFCVLQKRNQSVICSLTTHLTILFINTFH